MPENFYVHRQSERRFFTRLVIGYDEEIGGDPLFIDIANEDYPVFTAEHGMGEWDALEMYDSLEEFVEDVT